MKQFLVLLSAIVIFSAFTYNSMDAGNHGGRPLTATLSAANEIPPCMAEMDATGKVEIRINPGQGIITYEWDIENLEDVVAAHIHRGTAIQTGGVVVPLMEITGGTGVAEVEVSRELAKEIMKNPEGFYVNVHNVACRAGAIRGQLMK